MTPKVLVVDDNPTLRNVLCRMVKHEGLEADSVGSGTEALELLTDSDFNLIFLDLEMPGIDGVSTLRLIRELHGNIPIYISTGFYPEYMSSLKLAANEGIDFEIVEKPLTMSKLRMIIDNVFLNGEINVQI